MRASQAIRRGLALAVQFEGRATRSEFWWFAPIALVPPVIAVVSIDWQVSLWGGWKVLVVMGASVPLLSAMSRRLQDTGEGGQQAFVPFLPPIILWLGFQFVFWLSPAMGPGMLIVWWLLAVVLIPAHLVAFFLSAMAAASVIGQCIVSSEPGPNRYGPNPHEAAE